MIKIISRVISFLIESVWNLIFPKPNIDDKMKEFGKTEAERDAAVKVIKNVEDYNSIDANYDGKSVDELHDAKSGFFRD